jgi:hypothetical protein
MSSLKGYSMGFLKALRSHNFPSSNNPGIFSTRAAKATLCSAVARLLDAHESDAMRKLAQEMVPDSGADRAAEALLNLL